MMVGSEEDSSDLLAGLHKEGEYFPALIASIVGASEARGDPFGLDQL